jgi:hypothetical protein
MRLSHDSCPIGQWQVEKGQKNGVFLMSDKLKHIGYL